MRIAFYISVFIMIVVANSCSNQESKAVRTTKKIIDTKQAIDENTKLSEKNKYTRGGIGNPEGYSFKDTIK